MQKKRLSGYSKEEDYKEIYNSPKGTIIKIDSVDSDEYSSIVRTLNFYAPGNFEATEITPGTDHYTMFGPNHIVITKNDNVTD